MALRIPKENDFENTNWIQNIIESARDGIVSADENGTILSWNQAAETLFGYKKSEVLGKPLTIIIPKRFQKAHNEGIKRLKSGGKPKIIGKIVEVAGLTKEKIEFPIELSLSRWKENGKYFYTAVVRDITERFHIQNLKRMVAVGKLAGGISHEMNTPLAAISLYANQILETLQQKKTKQTTLMHFSKQILKATQELETIINQLKELSQENKDSQKQKCSVLQMIHKTVGLFQKRFQEKNISASIDKDMDFFILCNQIEIEQALLNILSNAYEAVQKLSKKWIQITLFQKQNHLEIHITDSGTGIALEQQDKIFHPFFTTREIGGGMGLGLNVAKSLIEKNNGSIILKKIDKKNKNTCFVVTVPLAPSSLLL